MIRRLIPLFLGFVLALGGTDPRAARAHVGDDHAEEPAPAGATAQAGGGSHVAESDVHELLVRIGELDPGHRATIRLLLSERDTNAPVGGAALEVVHSAGDTAWEARAESPGIYAAEVMFPAAGFVGLEVVVRRGDEIDLLSIDSVRVGPPPVPTAAGVAGGSGLPGWAFAAFAGFGVLAVLGLVLVARARGARRPSRALGLLAALSLAATLSGVARAHEGELHGDEEPPPALDAHRLQGAAGRTGVPPGARFMAKEAQFDLGLRTAVARLDSLAETRRAFGTVVADPSAGADVVAPQTGKFVGRRTWRIGDRVARGQALGALLVIDELPIRAPLGGTIAAVSVVPGQSVTAGQVIARVVNFDRVRVEVALYGDALSAATRARGAVVRLPALPGRTFPARSEGLAPTATGGPSVPLVLSVANAGDLLRPGMVVEAELLLPGAKPAIVVPAAAVLQTERGPAVFVKVAPEAFVLRPVTIGAAAGDRVAIQAGVAAGERVVVSATSPLLSTAESAR
jgi:multidrug efflux pump subunit AcrA (membrane-fusion protein)